MRFEEFNKKLQKHFSEMVKGSERLFEVDFDYEEMNNLYLNSFPAGTNEVYRKRREYDCSCCRHFIRDIGNVVAIKNGQLHTLWELNLNDEVFSIVAKALDEYIREKAVKGVYLRKEKRIGTQFSREMLPTGEVNRYDHYFIDLPEICIYEESWNTTLDGEKGKFRDTRNVFKRSLDEIDSEAVDTVLELISQNSLYKGAEWKAVLQEFKKYQKEYNKLSPEEKELWTWEKSISAGMSVGRIRNHSMGTLLVNLSEGMELDTAVKKYEQIVAPANYKRPKAIFTKKMLEDAKKTITELGYMDALQRRFATLDDITVNNILFSNKDAAKRITGADDLFGEMEKDVAINPKKFSKVEEISVRDFINNVLPTAKELEVFFENKHEKNMVSLIAPENKEAKTMFKWNNPFSWAYTGNITDSDIKENVKAAGGSVTGVLRFSIQWNDGGKDNSDLDAHCIEPNGTEIYYATFKKPLMTNMGGQLDIDIMEPFAQCANSNGVAVENITYATKSKMKPGRYKFFVNQFCSRGSKGFKAEVEVDGEIHSYEYDQPVRGDVHVAEVIMDDDGNFKVIDRLNGNSVMTSKEVWNVKTNQFMPVSVVCYSPNYWDEQKGIGHQHLFFMLKDCVNPEEPNGYYNEFLKPELEQHKRVFEALGAKAHVKDVDDQLSGIGFSLTKRNDLIVKVKGATERVLKIKF
jgi:hypothetical protein|nr:MAG TPA: hypothetical protein [Caudoviricetes sp.]